MGRICNGFGMTGTSILFGCHLWVIIKRYARPDKNQSQSGAILKLSKSSRLSIRS